MKTFVLSFVLLFSQLAYSQNKCIDIFTRSVDESAIVTIDAAGAPEGIDLFGEILDADTFIRQQITFVENQLRTSGVFKSPIDVTKRTEDFREKILPIMTYDTSYREALVSFMEADLRQRSALIEKRIAAGLDQYDAVIVGAGIHGIIAAQILLRENPSFKILIVEETDTGGSTFRYPGYSFRVNSSQRASGDGKLPLPGEGNINELPGLPIQVSDLTAVKYPAANDLGSALVAGLYAAVSGNANVDVLFSSKVTNIGPEAFTSARPRPFSINGKIKGFADFSVETSALILASGLGSARIPQTVKESLTREMVETPNPFKQLPRVMTFETIIRLIGQSVNPREFFAGKRIAIAGTGDSANVFIEFLLGYAPEKGYGFNSAQVGLPEKILWLSQTRESCEDFIFDARSRYAQIGTGFRSSSPNGEPIIEPIPEKLKSLSMANGDAPLILKLVDSRKSRDVDYVILATGFEGKLFELFLNQFKASGLAENARPTSDAELIESFFTPIKGITPGTGKVKTDVAQEANTYLDGKPETRSNIIVVGPAAGALAKMKELFGIIQNFVSIFNNAYRTVAGAETLAGRLRAAAPDNVPLAVDIAKGASSFTVKNIQQERNLGSATQTYLESVLVNAFNFGVYSREARIVATFSRDRGNIKIDSNYKIEEVVKLLAASRDFFPTLLSLLTSGGDIRRDAWEVVLQIEDGKVTFDNKASKLRLLTAELTGDYDTVIENPVLPLAPIELETE